MNYKSNIMILNDMDIGISKITLDKGELKVIDKSGIYCFRVFLHYNWKKINNIKTPGKAKIDFNEYILSENNGPALIWPTESYVEKINDDSLYFYFSFHDIAKNITYMNKRNSFDILPNSLEVKILINYKDAHKGSIIYEF